MFKTNKSSEETFKVDLHTKVKIEESNSSTCDKQRQKGLGSQSGMTAISLRQQCATSKKQSLSFQQFLLECSLLTIQKIVSIALKDLEFLVSN